MNKKLLFSLYSIFSPSGHEKKMAKFIRDYIRRSGQKITVSRDSFGNIYAVKGDAETYPCVVAHIDQVSHVYHSRDFKPHEIDGMVFGYSKKNHQFENLGADDKNGIFVALECLMEFPAIKCAFFREEEIGTIGSSNADMTFFDDCRFVLQCDRKHGYDLITEGCRTELCSVDFQKAIHPETFGYQSTHGSLTDVVTLKEQGLAVSCVNISCGYYSPHTDEETTDLAELENCLNFVRYIIGNVTDTYPHKYEEPHAYRDMWDFTGVKNKKNKEEANPYLEDEIAEYLFSHEGEMLEDLYDCFHIWHPECTPDQFLQVAEDFGLI